MINIKIRDRKFMGIKMNILIYFLLVFVGGILVLLNEV